MTQEHPNNPMHGIKLEQIVIHLQKTFGWEGLASRVDVNCFKKDPSVKSSLKFLRKELWAREQVEKLYLESLTTPDPWANSKKP